MDESVMRARRFAALAVALAAAAGNAAPASLPDPTRPPAQLAAPAEAGPQSGPVLQSVMISPARRLAIISGQTVALGQNYGDFRLVRVTESEAELRHGREVLTLKLFPDLDKQPAGRAARPQK